MERTLKIGDLVAKNPVVQGGMGVGISLIFCGGNVHRVKEIVSVASIMKEFA